MKWQAFQGEEQVKQKVHEVSRMGNEFFGGVTREAVIFQYDYR
jgi:hypothetical protein